MKEIIIITTLVAVLLGTFFLVGSRLISNSSDIPQPTISISESETESGVQHKFIEIDGLNIFYREAGNPSNPTLVLPHGFPTSSHMFRNLIRDLSDEFYLIAPDYPGFGNSDMPLVDEYNYSFDQFANVLEALLDQLDVDKFSIYLMDYGAPVGFRLASKYPERIESLIIQNGNAYEEGLREFWDPIKTYWQDRSEANGDALRPFFELDATIWQFTHGVRNIDVISPDNWIVTQVGLDRPGNQEIQLQMFYDYRTNVPLYPEWQAYLREYQPPTLIVWGQNDVIFPAEGAHPYLRDLEDAELHLLDTGHFALEEDGDLIANYIRDFLNRNVVNN